MKLSMNVSRIIVYFKGKVKPTAKAPNTSHPQPFPKGREPLKIQNKKPRKRGHGESDLKIKVQMETIKQSQRLRMCQIG